MAKCMHRWVDPVREYRWDLQIGPFSCGRPSGHRGLHALVANGAWAAWDEQGIMRLYIGQMWGAEPGMGTSGRVREALEDATPSDS